jgi:hypothetical protein
MAGKKPKHGTKIPPYKNTAASATARVKDLLARMTLEEKAAQMICVTGEGLEAGRCPGQSYL